MINPHSKEITHQELFVAPDQGTMWLHNHRGLWWAGWFVLGWSMSQLVFGPNWLGFIIGVVITGMLWTMHSLVCGWVHNFAAYIMLRSERDTG